MRISDWSSDVCSSDLFDSHALNAAEGLDPVDPAYAHVLRVSALLGALPVAVAATALDLLVVREIGGPYGLLTVLAWLLGAIAVVTFPARRVQRWGFKIGEGQLRVARGGLFRRSGGRRGGEEWGSKV